MYKFTLGSHLFWHKCQHLQSLHLSLCWGTKVEILWSAIVFYNFTHQHNSYLNIIECSRARISRFSIRDSIDQWFTLKSLISTWFRMIDILDTFTTTYPACLDIVCSKFQFLPICTLCSLPLLLKGTCGIFVFDWSLFR